MLYYHRMDISKGIDLAKSNNSKECMIFHYWFFNNEFKFQDYVCNVNIKVIPNLWGEFTPSWFSFNNSEMVEAVTLAFCSFQ